MSTLLRLSALLVSVLLALPAAAAPRTFVASYGLDTNPCNRIAPCRGFAAALAVTDPGGEVVALDSAGFGAISINKSVTIAAPPGVYAAMTATAGTIVSIAGAGIEVNLRGLRIIGQGASDGIVMTQGARLVLEDVLVSEALGTGIFIQGATEATLTRVRVENNGAKGVWVRDGAAVTMSRSVVTGHSSSGLEAEATVAATPTRAMIVESVFDGNGTAIGARGSVAGALVRVVAVRNAVKNSNSIFFGMSAICVPCADSTGVRLIATDNAIQFCGSGILASANSTVVASGNTITECSNGFQQSGTGVLVTMANNVVEGNTNPTSGSTTPGTLR